MPIKKRYSPLTFLIILCLCLGVYKITVMACVSKDSVGFMAFAEDLTTASAEAIRIRDQHPGYPAMILVAEHISGWLGFEPTLENRILAAQIVTLVCRTIAICFLYLIFQFFGDKKAALVTAVLFMLVPEYANNGSEVLSDWPSLMLTAISFFWCLQGLQKNNLLYFFWAGLFSGLAYWVRPEGAVCIGVMGLYTLVHSFRANRVKLWACLGIMVVSAGLITAPYMLYKGALFPKKKVGAFPTRACLESPEIAVQSSPFQANIAASFRSARPVRAALHLIEELFSVTFLFVAPLLWILLHKVIRLGRLRPQDEFLCLFAWLWIGLMLWLYCKHVYMSHRHLMPLVVFGFAWILKGLHRLVLLLDGSRQRLHRNTAVVIGIGVALFVPHLIRPAHADKVSYRQAGLWLRENTPAEASLAVFDCRVGFYAERSSIPSNHKKALTQDYLILESTTESDLPETARRVSTGQAEIDAVIEIYQLVP
jgi:hypothetical protein